MTRPHGMPRRDTVDNLPWEGAQPNRFTTAFEALADLLDSHGRTSPWN